MNIKETLVGPEYREWIVLLFKLDAIRIQMGSPVAVKAVRNIGNNGLYDLLLSCWIKLGIGGEDGMEVMWRDHDERMTLSLWRRCHTWGAVNQNVLSGCRRCRSGQGLGLCQ